MTADTAPHPECAKVADLVAAEITAIEEAFARRLVRIFLAMRPTVISEETNAAASLLDAVARIALREAGVGEAAR
ncbi:hypothetical protein [Streptosporangium sandarakinum]